MMRLPTAVLLLAAACRPLLAQWHTIPPADSIAPGQGEATFFAGPSTLTVSVLADDLVRVRFSPATVRRPEGRSWAVIKNDWPDVHVEAIDSGGSVRLSTRSLTVSVGKNPLRVSFRDRSGRTINEDYDGKGMSWSGREVRVWKTKPLGECYYGFGEKAGRLERSDFHMTMWNSDIPAYTPATDPLYESIPFFYGIRDGKAYGIFLDNAYRSSFDMGKEARDQYSFGAEDGDLTYYFFSGPRPEDILKRFTELVGRMPLPPLWSLGYQQCRWSYSPASRVREIANGFRSRNIPCDVIYLDIDYMDGYRIFTWNPQGFPHPEELVRELSSKGFHVAVIVDPGIKVDTAYAAYRSGFAGNHFLRRPDGSVFTGKVWPGICAFPDFTSTEARRWWGDQFGPLISTGIRGWWNDMNEPSVFDVPTKTIDLDVVHAGNGWTTTHAEAHNVYGMEMTRATYEGVRRILPNERPFVLTRASFAGGWRYSAAWTGDNVSSWDHLAMALAMCLNLSISGQPFVGSDIGGFIGHPSGELFARWLQLGVFTPLMRAHSVINERNKEPWEYGDMYIDINRETINLRYRLLPYIYTAMQYASDTGIPPMRPMAFDYPGDARFAYTDDQFMFGRDILVAPVLGEGSTKRSVVLPRGLWYDYWSGEAREGGATVEVDAPVGRIPFFVRAGSTIPMRQVVQHTGEAPIDPLTLNVYPDRDGNTWSSSYYEDDGISFAYGEGATFRRTMRAWTANNATEFRFSAAEGPFRPPQRRLAMCIFGVRDTPRAVTVNGRRLPPAVGGKGGWEYDAARGCVTLVIEGTARPVDVSIAR
ncbi:MAG: glycoside hydrolase family 31 protein [Bacteroidota bacterium]